MGAKSKPTPEESREAVARATKHAEAVNAALNAADADGVKITVTYKKGARNVKVEF